LDQTSLTLNDLNVAAESFVTTLRNSYHPRIVYPEIQTHTSPTIPVSSMQNEPELNPESKSK